MRLDPELLDRPPADGARVVALALCADAEEAEARLAAGAGDEALHDFRVAVRRLRATLRAWRAPLGASLRRRHLARLRRVTRATGPARDAEVLLAWLAGARAELDPSHRGAADWLADRAERRRAEAAEAAGAGARARFRRLAPKLRRRLAAAPASPPAVPPATAAGPDTFAAALATLARRHARALRDRLDGIAGPEDAAAAHAARIAGKRLRYLLEPLRGLPGIEAGPAVAALRDLQDLLGELHDAHAARLAVRAAQVEAAAERLRRHRRAADGDGGADVGDGYRPGLLALEQLAARRVEALHGRLAAEVLADRAAALLGPVAAVAGALEARAAPEAGGTERRLLLLELPAAAQEGTVEEVEEGFLPGDRLHESVARVRAGGEERHLRALGGARGEARREEPLSRATFEAFWPLTEGRRLALRRHRLPDEPGWRFDAYLDRRLVLAVAEPGSERPPPPWLEPLLVRDVTGERAYREEALARRAPRRGPDAG